jgi:CheY-specific phosphatase CheX
MRAQLGERAVVEASNHFWEQMLGITMETVPASEVRTVAGHVRGSVQLTGAWNGLVEVRLADRLAYFASAGMLMMPLEAVGEADVLDAVREIANMTAGTIKSSLPRPCAMSLPTSSLVADAWSGPSNPQDSLVVSLRHPTGDFVVRVLEQECVRNEPARPDTGCG